MTTLAYRRDIDGLRAIAVLAVVLFHFGVPGFTGGFVGVDIFFVISGYLITSIIWRQREAGRFSFVEFWARRARRILPALCVMMLGALMVGWFLLAPKDYSELGRSVHNQAVFISNLFFMRQDGYFDVASDLKPLLHTWSLSVEEQFYIIFPLLLTLLSSRLKYWRTALFVLLLVSFALSTWAVAHHPEKAFFLLPMRAWELLAGAMLAVIPAREYRASLALAQGVSLAGLGLILLAVFAYDPGTPFPGVAALLPVTGVVCLIWANGQQATLAGKLLGSRLLVGVGLISYSWYLWHWPVFVFGKYASVDGLGPWELGALFVLSLVLGYASWRFVEAPFRERRVLPGRKQILAAAGVALLGLGLVGKSLVWTQGLPWRLSPEALQYAQARTWSPELMACLSDEKKNDHRKFCHFGPVSGARRALVWGDSHASALVPALEDGASKYGISVTQAGYSGCLPFNRKESTPGCIRFNQRVAQTLAKETFSDVVLVARWSLYVYGQRDGDTEASLLDPATGQYDRAFAEQRFAESLRALVQQLRAGGHRVWLVKEIPLQEFSVPYRLSRLAMLGRPTDKEGMPLADHLKRQAYISQVFEQIAAADPGVKMLDPAPKLCSSNDWCRVELDGHALYTDDNHLSAVGSRYVEAFLEPLFKTLRNQSQASAL
ncbi:acyltransferase family protein [Pseudomonas sp. Bout1]|uniref:acyltransferase family protein n=1 Tax=Pseudomonas sp. Bout1 TaxID=3048600 RepID=UPI002AB55FF9|nr:acyltransferase family protein [Pseudomonas sp. Bout1]MDY7536088.1 acyltransferase family protein [Pseudomonas sp. Bout1]MEB0183291.1 acyltransferase family protein [Pseudomonas sp. Bout1]